MLNRLRTVSSVDPNSLFTAGDIIGIEADLLYELPGMHGLT